MALGDTLDTSQQPITAADPRVAQILAMIQEKAKAAAAPDAAQAISNQIPQQPLQQQLPLPAQPVPGTDPVALQQQLAAQNPSPQPSAQSPVPSLADGSQPNVPDTPQPSKPGPVKSFLISLGAHLANGIQGGSDALLHHAGLPTPYEKQKNALKMGLLQQQVDAITNWRNSQGSLAQSKADQLDAMNQPFVVPDDPSIPPQLRGQTITQGAWQGLSKVFGVNQGKLDVQSEKDKALLARAQELVKTGSATFQSVAGTSGGQSVFANHNNKTGEYTDPVSGKVLTDFKPASKAMQGALGGFGPAFAATRTLMAAYNENPKLLPVLAPMLAKMLAPNDPNAASVFASIPNGQPQDAAGNPIGLRMPNAPTSTTRTRGQFAEQVGQTMDAAINEINANKDQLGPFMGRVSDLYNSKIGAYGPEYSALQTDLHNIATGWGRLHGNSVETMKQFNDDLNTAKDPANLIAKLQRYREQAGVYTKGGKGIPLNSAASNGSSPAPEGTVVHMQDGTTQVKRGGRWVPQ